MTVEDVKGSEGLHMFMYAVQCAASDYFVHFLILVVAPYQSIKAIQRKDNHIAMKWLSFWVINHFIGMSEHHHFEGFLVYFPYYYFLKLAFILFLMFGGGSLLIYQAILDPITRKIGLFVGDTNKNTYVDPHARSMNKSTEKSD